MNAPPPPFAVLVTPKGTAVTWGANTSSHSQTFTVKNTGTNSDTYNLFCPTTGPVTCTGTNPTFVNLGAGASTSVQASYNVGAAGSGKLMLRAISDAPVVDTGYVNVTVIAPPTISLIVPALTSGSRAVVHSRQPAIRAFIGGTGTIDTAATVLNWRGSAVTGLSRHNEALLEWEVDSTHWLAIGDSAQAEVTACNTVGGCTTVSRWVVLENDQRPVLGFTGMPLEALGSGFSAPFGPFTVHQAELETGLAIPSYFSMGAGRSAGLVYSTRQSYPRALVNVDLELPWPTGTPSQVKLVLIDGAIRLDSVVYANTACLTGALRRCRATLQGDFAGGSYSTPTRKWLTVEAAVTSGGVTKLANDSVEVVLVDRRSTPYGSGWWPAGALQLVGSGPDRLLIGPTGAATVYRGNADGRYLPPPGSYVALINTGGAWELRPRGSLARIIFDGNGRQVASVDQNGNRDSISYSGATSTITSFVDPVGKVVSLGYDGNGKLAGFTDPGGRQSLVTISAGSNQLTYDSLSSPIGRSNTSRFLYRTYPGTNTNVLLQRVGVITDTSLVVYDSSFRRRPTQVKLPLVKDETGASVKPTITYVSSEGRGVGTLRSLDSIYVQVADPRNNWTRSLLSRWGQPMKTWDAIGLIGKAGYDPDGLPVSSEGKTGDSSRTYQAYDGARRLVKTYIIRGGGSVFRSDSLVYDANHRVVKHVDARGKVDSVAYDLRGNVITARDAAGNVTRWAYRSDGLLDSLQAPGETKYRKFAYDATWKNRSQTLDENGQLVAQTAFDGVGRDTTTDTKIRIQLTGTVSQWQWRRLRTRYGSANQADTTMLVKSAQCADPCTVSPGWNLNKALFVQRVARTFDRAGRDSLRVGNTGVATLYLYDRLGRVVSRRPWVDSMAVKDSMVYDVAGNLKKSITRRGHTITTDFDSRNRDTLTVVPGVGTMRKSFAGPADQLTRLWYTSPTDSIGAMNAESRWGYDTRGRLRADTSFTGSVARSTGYSYDTFERPSTVVDPRGTWAMRYETTRGLLDTLLTPFSDTLDFSTDPRGRPSGVTVRSSGPLQNVSQGWNASGPLATRAHSVCTTVCFTGGAISREEVVDPVGPTLGPVWVEQKSYPSPLDSLTDSLRYDGWERLQAWVGLKNGVVVAQDSFAFDLGFNLSTVSGGQVYDAVTDRLVQQVEGGVTKTYVYDRAGNLTQVKQGATIEYEYGYDALNRLVSVRRLGTLMARYAYDVLGRRIAKRVYSAASGGAVGYTRFSYSGDHVSFESDSSGTLGLRYTWDRETDRLTGVRDAAGTQFYAVTDQLGSVRGLFRRDGTWWLSQRFGPYGAVVARDTTTAGPAVKLRYGWTGREYDAETGFYFLRARYYSPVARRFVQEDPIGHAGSSNVYAYADGQVFEATDPTGLMTQWWRGGAGGIGRPEGRNNDYAGRFDLWGGSSYQDELMAQHDAEYEEWVAAGSGTVNGYRVLESTPINQFVSSILDASAPLALGLAAKASEASDFTLVQVREGERWWYVIWHEAFRRGEPVAFDYTGVVFDGHGARQTIRTRGYLSPVNGATGEIIEYSGVFYFSGYSDHDRAFLAGEVIRRIGRGFFKAELW